MDHDQSKELAFRFLLEDLEDVENKQKGKQAAGNLTDNELAFKLMREEILNAQTSIEDGILALSISSAVATDQNILASIRREERIAEQDRRYALALSNGQPIPRNASHVSAASNPRPAHKTDDAVSVGMEDLMGRTMAEDNGEGSSKHIASSSKTSYDIECAACLEKHDSAMFVGACGHEYCRDCTRQIFLGATRDEQLYPPRCCGNIIPPGIGLRFLDYEELRAFGQRAIEWATKDRLYCADPTCSKFIPPFTVKDEHGCCPECGKNTHVLCRSLEHPNVDCPLDEALQSVLAMAEAHGWRRCFNCRTMVELKHGCNHIRCRGNANPLQAVVVSSAMPAGKFGKRAHVQFGTKKD
ncbi:RING [Aspergillus sclerotialis]|uniref:RING n=1 Tax=Aspergillus sclerotialis TaxID=2070753 RepID=A0A3A2ZPE8_9EURO|nr:RING [Aspergillus sclerotialis]